FHPVFQKLWSCTVELHSLLSIEGNLLHLHIFVYLSVCLLGPPVVCKPFVPVPECYAGDMGTCQGFLMQVSLVFEQQPLTYCTDHACIAYLLSLLTGVPVCHNYAAFVQEMKRVFEYPHENREPQTDYVYT
uniref:Uncharacterized protein n=1 Tax=Acanthochromis polyacanthus TaxID=80966 RepID=A0A3Q1ERS8_9TELE